MSAIDARAVTQEVLALFRDSADGVYFGEQVTQLEHALQCAAAARTAGADEETILAALLHDIGHLLGEPEGPVGVIHHDTIGRDWLLARGFSERVASLVEGHVDAKRYLTATNPAYAGRLSEASRQTLRLQGGPMSDEEAGRYSRGPLFREKLQLRSWDEAAKEPGLDVPGLGAYAAMIERHLARG